MVFETVRYERDGAVATITLNRPDRHNAFTVAMARELRQIWTEVERDPAVVSVVVTGAGEKAFCTGMDVADIADGSAREEAARMEREDGKPFYHFLTAVQNGCWKPVVTAVNGMVVGGGLHFLADSDLVVASQTATFFDTHVKVGLVAGLEPVGLARRIPLEAALRMALLGGAERMTAEQALAIGLVGELQPPHRVVPRAQDLAAKIAEHSPTALARSKRAIWESLEGGLHAGLDRANEIIRSHDDHPDVAEGSRAFVEKRKPRWAPYTGE